MTYYLVEHPSRGVIDTKAVNVKRVDGKITNVETFKCKYSGKRTDGIKYAKFSAAKQDSDKLRGSYVLAVVQLPKGEAPRNHRFRIEPVTESVIDEFVFLKYGKTRIDKWLWGYDKELIDYKQRLDAKTQEKLLHLEQTLV